MKKLLQLLGAIALTLTLSSAADMKCESGKCGKAEKKEMKCQAGKCAGANKKDMKEKTPEGKCNGSKKESPKKGKCGQGKCG